MDITQGGHEVDQQRRQRDIRRICVYCGSSPGFHESYASAARGLGALLAERGIELVFGGGCIGLMKVIADTVLERGGRATGVIPRSLVDRELAHRGLTDLRVVESMHERKALMAELSDGFIAMPGGIGTFEEFLEALTWGQLGFHAKPCGLLNTRGYFDLLLSFLDHSVGEGFLNARIRDMIIVDPDPAALLESFAAYTPPSVDKAREALLALDN